jgi:hypothetical protein
MQYDREKETVYLNIALAYANKGNIAEGLNWCKKYLALDPASKQAAQMVQYYSSLLNASSQDKSSATTPSATTPSATTITTTQ